MKIYYFVIFLCISTLTYSQEKLSTLRSNPLLHKQNLNIFHTSKSTLNIPFIDDFSKNSFYPDSNLWQDNNVFINRTYPVDPITIGVATFDGLDSLGFPYDITAINMDGDTADFLTSKRIDLSNIDTAFLLFYYQPKGLGDSPQVEDSLFLQFLNDSLEWVTVWKTYGQGLSSFKKQVILFTTSNYNADFKFRFLNYATISGNYDHWHLDYVKLDEFTTSSDTNELNDVAFVYNNPSFLKRYREMPWSHYKDDVLNELIDTIDIQLRNNGASISVDYQYNVYENGILVDEYPTTGSSRNVSVQDYDSIGIYSFENPPIFVNSSIFPTTFSALNDSASFLVEHIIGTTPNDNKMNDTLLHQQNFFSYFAYDDGTAESAYGINVNGAMGAYEFKLNRPDTLRAVQMYFPEMLDSVNNIPFYLTIWKDINGSPGDIIYSKLVYPKHTPKHKFCTYSIDSLFQLTGTFYVGWEQTTNDLLNIGLDRNNIANNYMFYNIGNSGFIPSQFPGSWMIRPIVSQNQIIINTNNTLTEAQIFPNPFSDFLYLKFQKEERRRIFLFNMNGKLVYDVVENSHQIVIPRKDLKSGIYLIEILGENSNVRQKLIVY